VAINLDKIDRRILYELDKNARISDSKLAKLVNRSRESVRYRINKMQKQGIIVEFLTSLNPAKTGYLFYKLYLQLRNNPKERKEFFNFLHNHKGMYWYGTNDGVWDCHMTIFAKNPKEFNDIKNEIYRKFKNIIIKRDIGQLVKTRQYPKKFILDKTQEIGEIEEKYFAGDIKNEKIDELDMKIMMFLAHNARASLVDIAKNVNSTIDIVRGRMKKLEEKQIIIHYRIAIDPSKIGFILFKSFIYFDSISEENKMKLIEYVRTSRNIVYLIEQVSSWEFEIELLVESYEEFLDIMNELRLMFQDCLRNYEFCLMKDDILVYQIFE
jgi:Lrp/AsnC family transcriptional regulator, leucine-responsive regulatory protein